MIKEHDQQAKMKATQRKLAYVDSDKEAPTGSLTRGFSDRFSLESFGTSDTRKQTRSASKSRRTPSKNEEPTHLKRSRRLENRSITKKKARRERSKPKGKRSERQETSSDSEREEGSEDTCEDLNSRYKRPKPIPFTQRITHFKYHMRAKLPRNIRVYERNKDPEDHLGIFSAAAEQEEWPMPVWCKMFHQTLGGAARNGFDDLDPKSVNSFEELSQKFLKEFSQQKSSHIKGVPPVLCISDSMHGHGHPELAKKLNDKIPKTLDEMFERLRAFIRGEVVVGSAEIGSHHQRLLSVKKENRGSCGPGKLAHLVKDIHRTNQRNGSQGRNSAKVINMIKEGGNRKSYFEEGRSGLTDELTFPAIPRNQLTDEHIILEGIIKGNQVRRIFVDGGSSSEIMYEHCFRNLNINIGSRLRRCRASMVGFSGETHHPVGVIDLLVTMGRA
ncbi:hypothetical protein Tco_0803852 [Tanacetum coccineum]|uniref:Reverse transcriptase domain-containing protein n=1 Tax=Tanacetum coccineum TaxID=301880 RepID=A0ABQ5A2S7_9ASTR